MRIAMISEHASPLAPLGSADAGGQNVYVAELASGLGRRGHEVRVYTRRDATAPPDEVSLAPGVLVVHVPAGPPSALPKDELEPFMLEFGRWVAREWARDGAPDLVHAHFWMSGLAAQEAARLVPVPVVQTFHALGAVKRRHQGSADTSPQGRLAAENRLIATSDLIVATCRDERAELLALEGDPDRIDVIPCGVDLEEFRCDRPRPATPPRLVALGRLVERKGVDIAVRALAELPGAELVVAGGPPKEALTRDPEANRLLALARELGVADRVDLRGCVGHDHVATLLRSADVVVCTPWYEPFGMVPLEAMACGRPVVGTAVGGLLDTVEDGVTGYLVPPRDVAATARAIRRILQDPQLAAAMSAAARERVEHRYGWRSVVELTESSYHRLLRRYRRARPTHAEHTRRRMEEHAQELAGVVRAMSRHAATVDRWGGRIAELLGTGGRVLVAGNGGSAAEAQHFTAELVGRYLYDRRPLSALCLSAETSSLTAISNDYGSGEAFARQVQAHGRTGDILLLLSTSGRSPNVLRAAERGRTHGLHVWALTGRTPNPLADLADEVIGVESTSTSVVQEAHLLVLHAACAATDARLLELEARPSADAVAAGSAAARGLGPEAG